MKLAKVLSLQLLYHSLWEPRELC